MGSERSTTTGGREQASRSAELSDTLAGFRQHSNSPAHVRDVGPEPARADLTGGPAVERVESGVHDHFIAS
jgi:hypothetical protein